MGFMTSRATLRHGTNKLENFDTRATEPLLFLPPLTRNKKKRTLRIHENTNDEWIHMPQVVLDSDSKIDLDLRAKIMYSVVQTPDRSRDKSIV